MTDSKRAFGTEGEELAARFLVKKKKMKLLQKNFCVRGGEIDLILMDKKTLVFCEVKTRTQRSSHLGSAALAVDHRKQRHLTHAAKIFLAKFGREYRYEDCRFDVIELYLPEPPTTVYVRHTPYAFEARR